MAFPGLITIVDCQRTCLVVGLPDLLLPASNLIGSETLSAWACSPSSSSQPDLIQLTPGAMQLGVALQGSSNRNCFHLSLFELSRWYTLRWISIFTVPSLVYKGIFWLFSHLKPIPCDLPGMRHPYGWDLLQELQGRKEWNTSCNCAWEQLRRLLNR